MILKFLLKHVAGPLVGTVAAKVGEAIGDRLAYEINPPEETVADEAVVDAEIVEDESVASD